MKSKSANNIIRIALITAFILLIPFVAMQFSQDVDWGLFDFIFAGTLIFGTGLAYELVTRKAGSFPYRVGVALALAAAFLLIWVNAAVGIIGSEDNFANIMYVAVLAVGFLGSISSWFKPRGMARTMFAAALFQGLITIIALFIGWPELVGAQASKEILRTLGANAMFIVLFVGSAMLFQRASATPN